MEYIGAIIIGVVLGLIGGGGSLLAVPWMVYFIGITPLLATAYSLFIVGTTSTVGSMLNSKKGLINYPLAITFSIPTILAIYVTRKFLLPLLPEVLYTQASFSITRDAFIMVFFACIMFFSALSVIRAKKAKKKEQKIKYTSLVFQGLFVGTVAGIVGAGGGFLIVPALVTFSRMPIKNAIATSLLIVSFQSLIGFFSTVNLSIVNWSFLIPFSLVSLLGVFLGVFLSRYILADNLKKVFAVFVLGMSITILCFEFL